MNSADLAAIPLPGAGAERSAGAATGAGGRERDAPGARAMEAAREFERLLIHDLLKTSRRAGAALGETPSNARATYDDMLDERLAGIVSEAGGFGLAPLIAAQLDGGLADDPDGAVAAVAPGRAGGGSGVATGGALARPTERLATADLLRLRALVGSRADETRTAGRADAPNPIATAAGAGGIRPTALLPPAISPPATGTPLDAAHRAFLEPLLPEARVSARRLGTSPDVVLAVAALESGWGEHVARDADGRSSHNLFGIKARPGERDAVSHRTTEYLGGRRQTVVADFRAFADRAAAVNGFADFVLDNPRYAGALEHAADPSEFLRRLHAAGYATDPRYADKAIAVMQRVRALRENRS